MVRRRTVDLLPEIFRTDTNRKFLAATLDQMIQEPNMQRTQGFVGRRVGPGVNPADNYVVEPTAQRNDYQLEPGVVFLQPDTNRVQDAITYPGMLAALEIQAVNTARQDRFWESQYYPWDPFCDLDKFTNYSQYYWLPEGPDAVDVSNVLYPLTDEFDVSRTSQGYDLSGWSGNNPEIYLVRGGNYEFRVDQPGHGFWIQTAPGSLGRLPFAPNISSRDVLGVSNNGAAQGTVVFDVPLRSAQDIYYEMPMVGSVDLVTDLRFDQINGVFVEDFLLQNPQGIDGITNLEGRTVIFTDRSLSAEQGGWITVTQFSPLSGEPTAFAGEIGSFDTQLWDQALPIEPLSRRYSVWRIEYAGGERKYLRLRSVLDVAPLNKVSISFGSTYSNTQWFKNSSGYWEQIPLLSALSDILYYQDGTDTDTFGIIRLIDPAQTDPLDINEIVGSRDYVSPNGRRFTNGLKVVFRGLVEPASYRDREFYVEGVGSGLGIDQRVGFVDGQAYFGPWHVVDGQRVTGSQATGDFQQFIYEDIETSIVNRGRGTPELGPLPLRSQPGAVNGNGIRLVPVDSLVTPERYLLEQSTDQNNLDPIPLLPDYITINRSSQDLNAWSRSNRWFHQQVIKDTAAYNNTVAVFDNLQRAKRPIIEFRANINLFDAGTQGIMPVDVIDFGRVEIACTETDAATDLITAASTLDLTVGQKITFAAPTLGGLVAGDVYYVESVSSITEFSVSTTPSGPAVSLTSAQGNMTATAIQDDALSNVAGSPGYTIDGYELQQGSRVIFAADADPLVRNRVYRVDFIDPDGSGFIINLVPLDDAPVAIQQQTVCLRGDTLIGRSFWYDGVAWAEVQAKNGINQPPLFDVYDINGRSFGDTEAYPSTNFRGNRLFGYAVGGTSREDEVLGFALRYRNINNIGDIVFENYFYNDSFVYLEGKTGTTVSVSSGVARQYIDRVTFSDLIGWISAPEENRSRQIFRFTWAGEDLVMDVAVTTASVYPPVQLYVGGVFVDPDSYTVTVTGNNTVISLSVPPATGTVIEAQVLSDQVSRVAFYEIPANLEYNALNQDSRDFTLGSIRNHYESICQNNPALVGPAVGSNNSRDLGDILPYGTTIVQQSAPLVLAGSFLRRAQYNIFDALIFNSQEYEKYKARMMDLVSQGDFVSSTPTQILDQVVEELAVGRTEQSPFYWSDMLPANETFTEITYVISPISIPVFDLTRVYDFTSSNFQSVLVFLNGNILTRDYEYTVGSDSATVTISVPLAVGDQVVIREYTSTFGNFVPNTPTKMGLYPAYRPHMYLDSSYVTPIMVIRGHDGSITRAYGDVRDQVLLEFEKRIFNNIKIQSDIPLRADEVVPGQFRVTDYSLAEVTSIMSSDFLSWVGWNRLDYTTQSYQADNAFTYNYSQASDRLTRQPLLGAWRGIYEYFYDTTAPTTRPWEMLGFSEEPSWWQDTYGPPPYTSGNLVLWEDMANGIVADPVNPRVLPLRRRPGLLDVIPAGSEGELLSPLDSVVGIYDDLAWRRSWTVGDDGPVENAWRTSSAYPFAVMRLLALTKPAKFFSLFADRDRYGFDSELDQYLWQGRYRLDAAALAPIYGNGVSRASFINWIVDFNRQRGVNSTRQLETQLANTDVKLCWRLAGFSDKKLLKIYVERSTPGGNNAGFLLPDESYQLLLYKNQPATQVAYSSVIVQSTDQGWSVQGYNLLRPYFTILASRVRGVSREISAGGETVRVPTQYTEDLVRVPYGYVFTNRAAVCDFLLSYGQYLARQGCSFDQVENGYTLDWNQMCSEFLYWSAQGWTPGALINLNPAAQDYSVTRPGEIADSLTPTTAKNIILGQNRQPVPLSSLIIDRLDNTMRLRSQTADTINYVSLDFTSYEHILVLDNTSLFGDLVFEPRTGARQSRVLVSGWISGDWNGQVDAPGFVLNQDNVREWSSNVRYNKGEIVLFKDEYWSASATIQPSEEFNYNLWIRSDFDEIQLGLLPNAATGSVELAQAYDTQVANLEQEIDLFSYGLIGFRPRQYMQALNLDDVSQVNLYKQFLGTKGTRSSAELFTLADLGKETAEYNIYEYWSVLRSTYGANANRSYFELLLDQSRLLSDPSLIQVTFPDQPSTADQTVFVENIWNSSYPITSPNILTTTLITNPDRSLSTAGYVNFNDVDFRTFSLDQVDVQASDIDINSIGIGTTIWVARTNAYDWNIYSCEFIPAEIVAISDNLDGFALVTFNAPHGLVAGDHLIIRFFNDDVDGFYRVEATPSLVNVLILYEFTGFQTTITGLGTGFTLTSLRVSQPADIVDLPISRELTPGTKIWVDNDSQGRWEVLEKTSPFSRADDLQPETPVEDSQYGAAVSQGLLNLTAFVGSPGYGDPATGTVYAFVKNTQDSYVFGAQISLNVANCLGFGGSIDVGNQSWAVIGANASNNGQGYAALIYNPPYSNTFEQSQILIAPDLDWVNAGFGSSVTMSQDEQWVYVSAPGRNKVYAYARVAVQPQQVRYTSDGSTTDYNWDDSIIVDPASADQLQVLVNGRLLFTGNNVPGYSVSGSDVVLNPAPPDGAEIDISRRTTTQLDRRLYYSVPPSSVVSAGPGTGQGALFTVDVIRGIRSPSVTDPGQDYNFGDTITIDAGNIGGGSSLSFDVTQVGPSYSTLVDLVAGNAFIQVSLASASEIAVGQEIFKITGAGNVPSSTTVANVATSTGIIEMSQPASMSGDFVFMVSPNSITTIGNIVGNSAGIGNTAVFDLQSQLFTATDIDAFRVVVDDEIQRPFIDYTFASGNITFVTVPPVGADIIVDSIDHYQYVDTIVVPGLAANASFGHSVSTTTDGRQVIVGAPAIEVNNIADAGVAYVIDRTVQRFLVANASVTTYSVDTAVTAPVRVLVNGQPLLDADVNVGGQYTVTTGPTPSVTFVDIDLAVGDVIEVETNQFGLLQTITAQTPSAAAGFGYVVDQCVNDCSLYVSAPFDSTQVVRAGLVEFHQNQARIYGTIQNTNSDPVLTPGDHLRVNNIYVELSDPAIWSSSNVYAAGDFVQHLGGVYISIRTVPTGIDIADSSYWAASNWIAVLAQDINATVPNVQATAGTEYLTISVLNRDSAVPFNLVSVLPGTGSLFQDLGYDVYVQQQVITSPILQQQAQFGQSLFISDDTTTLIVGAPTGSMILPTTFDNDTTVFDADSTRFPKIVLESGAVYEFDFLPATNASITNPAQFVFGQQITRPNIQEFDRFGQALDLTTGTLLIGSPANDLGIATPEPNYGTVMQLVNATRSPAWRVLRQQEPSVDISLLNSVYVYDRFTGIRQYLDYFDPLQGRLLGAVRQNLDFIGAIDPAAYNVGTVNNYGNRWAQERVGQIWWDTSRSRFIDPNQGDPTYASLRWGQLFPGSTVLVYQWISSTVPPGEYTGPGTPRSIDSYVVTAGVDEQGLLLSTYYFWVLGLTTVDRVARKTLSTATLARYIENPRGSGIAYIAPIGPGTIAIYNSAGYIQALDTVLHIEFDREANDAAVHVEYQLIAQDKAESFLDAALYRKLVDSFSGTDSLGNPVPDPFLPPSEQYGVQFRPRQSMFRERLQALQNYITATNRVLLTFPAAENRIFNILNRTDPEPTSVSTYEILSQDTTGNGTDTITVSVARGIIVDSKAQIRVNGQLIDLDTTPNPMTLTYEFEPGTASNTTDIVFSQNLSASDTVEIQLFALQWNQRLANYEELTFQNIDAVPLAYRYLVASDSTNNGLWTIYEVETVPLTGVRRLQLIRVQTYDTRQYWQREDWFQPGYDPLTRIVRSVPNVAALQTITVPQGSAVRVISNPQGLWEIYQRQDDAWTRVALQDGTIQFSAALWDYSLGRYGFDVEVFDAQYFDQEPAIETRNVIDAINQEIFVNDLAIERNRLLTLMFNFILTEQLAPDWLTKTSLIDVDHVIRNLEPFQIYREDNQDFVLQYIQEVKPYHVQIREFNLRYRGRDQYLGNATDFDLPAYWDDQQQLFVSPVLDDTGQLSSTSSVPATSPVWQTFPWNQWFDNYLLTIESVSLVDGGSGYTVPPQITVVGPCLETAQMRATINSQGQVSSVIIVNPGRGYAAAASLVFTGGNGSGARAVANMSNDLVRQISTSIKFDRYQYQTDITDWQPNQQYLLGQRVRYRDRVYRALALTPGSATFDPDDWAVVPAGDLNGIDRTRGYYLPGPNMPGLDLAQVITGLDYPGVQVYGIPFPQTTEYISDGSTTQYAFDSNQGIFSDLAAPDQQVTVEVSGIPVPLGTAYTVTFDPNEIDFVSAPPINAPIKITVGYPISTLGDAIYASDFADTFLGTRPTDINVSGGAFVDTYSSHAPEELMPGSGFDTVDIRVFTTPGSDWQGPGHGFPIQSLSWAWSGPSDEISFESLVPYPVQVRVWNQNTGLELSLGTQYTVDWPDRIITVQSGVTAGQVLRVLVYELGGGNQLYRNGYAGNDIGNHVIVPISRDLIFGVAAFVNGVNTPVQFINQVGTETDIVFFTTFTASDYVVITVFGSNTNLVDYSWSTPQTQYIVFSGPAVFNLTNATTGTNPINAIVNVNGLRVQPPGSIQHIGNNIAQVFVLPESAGYNDGDVTQGDIDVLIDGVPQAAGSAWVLDPYDGSSELTLTFTTAPVAGAVITISVSTGTPYRIVGSQMTWTLSRYLLQPGDVVSVTTWNDTRQQDLLTQVWQGPRSQGVLTFQGYDDTGYDPLMITTTSTGTVPAGAFLPGDTYVILTVGTTDFTAIGASSNTPGIVFVATGPGSGTGTASGPIYNRSITTDGLSGTAGSFDYGVGTFALLNRFDTGRPITNPSRLEVTLNGQYLWPQQGFTVEGSVVVIPGAPISATAIVVVTSMTMSTIPGAVAFRIFQDMRGLQSTYRITDDTSTVLVQDLSLDADVIYVRDAGNLPVPNLALGRFGLITIGGERISYRSINLANNTVSGLRRGTAGTGATAHLAGSVVYSISLGNLLPVEYQDRVVSRQFLSEGSTTQFVATGISLPAGVDPAEAVEVYQGNLQPGQRFTGDGSTTTFQLAVPLTYYTVWINSDTPSMTYNVVGDELIFDEAPALDDLIEVRDYEITSVSPVTVEFDQPPPDGVEVSIRVRRGLSWYRPGVGTASDGVPLQETNTEAARFIRGL